MKGNTGSDYGGTKSDPGLVLTDNTRTVLNNDKDIEQTNKGDRVGGSGVSDRDSGAGFNARVTFRVHTTGTYHILAVGNEDTADTYTLL